VSSFSNLEFKNPQAEKRPTSAKLQWAIPGKSGELACTIGRTYINHKMGGEARKKCGQTGNSMGVKKGGAANKTPPGGKGVGGGAELLGSTWSGAEGKDFGEVCERGVVEKPRRTKLNESKKPKGVRKKVKVRRMRRPRKKRWTTLVRPNA